MIIPYSGVPSAIYPAAVEQYDNKSKEWRHEHAQALKEIRKEQNS